MSTLDKPEKISEIEIRDPVSMCNIEDKIIGYSTRNITGGIPELLFLEGRKLQKIFEPDLKEFLL